MAKPYPPNPYPGLPAGSTPAEEALYDSGGPYWWRGLAEGKDGTVCKWAKELQGKIGARRIIGVRLSPCSESGLTEWADAQGHTPNFEKIVDRCNASVIIIDTAMSRAYGGVLSALEIVYELYPASDKGEGGRGADHRQEPLLAESADPVSEEVLASFGRRTRVREKETVTAVYETKRKVLAVVEQEIDL